MRPTGRSRIASTPAIFTWSWGRQYGARPCDSACSSTDSRRVRRMGSMLTTKATERWPNSGCTSSSGSPDRVGPEIISPVLASSGTIAGLFSLLGAHEVRVWPPRQFPGWEQVSFMACRISELVLGCRDPEVLARFWCEVLDFVVLDREDDGSVEIGPREGFGGPQPTIILSRRDEPEQGKSRLHIDVNATDRDQDAELERLLKLGARPADIGQTGQEQWHVLADPEGNEFCLLKARLNPL